MTVSENRANCKLKSLILLDLAIVSAVSTQTHTITAYRNSDEATSSVLEDIAVLLSAVRHYPQSIQNVAWLTLLVLEGPIGKHMWDVPIHMTTSFAKVCWGLCSRFWLTYVVVEHCIPMPLQYGCAVCESYPPGSLSPDLSP